MRERGAPAGLGEPAQGIGPDERAVPGRPAGARRQAAEIACVEAAVPLEIPVGGYFAPVSQEHVDKTRAFIENYNRRDFDAVVRDFHEEVDFVLPKCSAPTPAAAAGR